MRLVRMLGAVGLLWCAVWAALALALPAAATRARQALEARGWQVATGPVRAGGFPLAIAGDAGPAEIALPDGAGVLRAERLSLSAPLLAPVTLRAGDGGAVAVVLPAARVTVAAARAEVEAVLRPTPALTFRRASARLSDVAVTLAGGVIGAERAEARLSARPGQPAVLGFEAEIAGLALPAALVDRIAAAGALPAGLPRLNLAAEAAFTRPWDRAALDGPPPQPMRLTLRRAAADWGAVSAEAEGLLRIDPEGVPEGEIRLSLPDAGAALGLAVAAGLLPEPLASRLARLAPPRQAAAAGPRRFGLTFTFRDGRVLLGGADLGAAPAIRLP